MNWDSKQRAYSCFPIELDWVLGFTVPVQPNLRAVKMSTRPSNITQVAR